MKFPIIIGMRMRTWFILGGIVSMTGAGLRAEIVVLKDGTTRQGTIERRDEQDVVLRLDQDGIRATVSIPIATIARIGPSPATLPAVATTGPATAGTQEALKPVFAPRVDGRGFLAEMALSAVGKGPGDPERLPAAQRAVWERAMRADAQGHRADTLAALQELEAVYRDVPGGMARLDGVARHARDQTFGQWMGKVHWDVIAERYRTGQFDLKDVRAAEKPVLIGILREKTAPALEPLKSYFSPINPRTGNPEPFKFSHLQALTVSNALEVKDRAMLAAAVLLAQLNLEPEMPSEDRVLLQTQLAAVNRILARAKELEPAARMAQAKADNDRRMAEQRALRDAAMAKQRGAALGAK